LEFRAEVNHEETRVMELSSSEDPTKGHDRSTSHIDTVSACDEQIDGQTDGRIYYS